MKCKNCGLRITSTSRGPKPFLSIKDNGTYGSFACIVNGVVNLDGHNPDKVI